MIKIGNKSSEFSSYTCKPTTKEELQDIIEDRISKEGPNCDLHDIDTSLITDMSWVFFDSDFNGDISNWDVSNVENMTVAFYRAKFNQDISNWNIRKGCYTENMFTECPIKDEFKPKI